MIDVRLLVDARDALGETPLWCESSQRLWWLDVDGCVVQRLDYATGRHDRFPLHATAVGSLALCAGGGLLVARDLALDVFDPASGAARPLCQVEPATADIRLNDGRCDAAGRFWVGTLDNQLSRPNSALYRVDPDGTVTRMVEGVIVSNTIAIAPDQGTLYYSDTRRFTTWAFDLADGRLSNRRVFIDFSGKRERPDGACVDAEGCLWIAIFAGGRIDRYTPEGRLDRTIALPVTNPTCVCFGGPDLKTLLVTTARKFLADTQLAREPWAGGVIAIEQDVQGLPEARFAA